MNDERKPVTDDAFEQRAREAFAASVDAIDEPTRARLAQARQQALAAVGARRSPARHAWRTWVPAGALAAGLLVAALVLRAPGEDPSTPQVVAAPPPVLPADDAADAVATAVPLEMLSAGDDEFALATAEDDLEFYEWLELAETVGDGQSG